MLNVQHQNYGTDGVDRGRGRVFERIIKMDMILLTRAMGKCYK